MSRLVKSQDCFIMKCMGIVLLLGFISLGAIGGCSNNGDQGGTQTLTENDFSEDSSILADADDGIVVDFLESPAAEKPEQDTDEAGIDVIPYTYDQTFENTFCWEDEDQGAEHFMILADSDGLEVLMVEANGDCVTAVIEEGDYEMRLHHDGRSEDPLAIFIQPTDDPEGLGARNTRDDKGILKTAKGIISKTLSNSGIVKEARAQLPLRSDIGTLLKTGNCSGCKLVKVNLAGADLSGTNLEGAKLSFANLQGAKLALSNLAGATVSFANLSGADLTESNLAQASLLNTNFTGANLTFANLTRANMATAELPDANLTGADLTRADLTRANLAGAILTRADLTSARLFDANLTSARLLNANLSGADLTRANLSGATWCDGQCVCSSNSIGTCNDCASVDICTGP